MTVKQLIDALQELDPNAVIALHGVLRPIFPAKVSVERTVRFADKSERYSGTPDDKLAIDAPARVFIS